ncbi:hypothetical protein CXB51_027896 [Gossypium anomalum]|uniref:DUF4283 domain-containing protein n=1 Tax=Gossypium anomalum TaxID=47600 RepID=A0A8J5YBU3_9ROSI|nr:hypothetical protein CXB51_027896 [Gossypium anomalum]
MNDPLSSRNFVVRKRPTGSNSGVSCATKKVRRRMEAPPDTNDPIVDDGDVVIELVKGISSITLSSRVHQLIERKMAKTIAAKLLGRKIGFNTLLNKMTSLWSPKSHMQLMDLENYYYLVRFQYEEDFNKVLVRGPWVIFCQYLTIRSWSPNFFTSDNEMDVQVMWIRLPSLLESYYSNFLLRAISQAIVPVVMLDIHRSSRRQGHFARLAVCVDSRKPLVSKIKINARIQKIKYEGELVVEKMGFQRHREEKFYGSWMLVERWQRGKSQSTRTVRTGSASNGLEGSRFSALEVDLSELNLEIIAMDGGIQPNQIKGCDLRRNNFTKAGKSSKKESFLGKKGTAKAHGQGIVIGSRPKSGPNVLRPTKTNIGSTANNGGNGFNDGSGMGLLVPNRKKPPGCELVGLENPIVDVIATIEGIVRGVEWGPDANLMADMLLLVMEIIDDYIGQWYSGDGIIAKLGLANSFRIEARGFSVYASPQPEMRQKLWEYLDSLAKTIREP